MCDSVLLPQLLDNLETELGNYYEQHGKSYAAVRQKSKIWTDHTQANKQNDINHIDYVVPPCDEEKLREYTQFISWECRIRSIPLLGNLDDWRHALNQSITMEKYILYLEKVRQWDEEGQKNVPLV